MVTGAIQRTPGCLELAAGGTLFLDEIDALSLALQAKFLRVLQEQQFTRVGGTETLTTDARIVAATHQDLQQLMAEGRFRSDCTTASMSIPSPCRRCASARRSSAR